MDASQVMGGTAVEEEGEVVAIGGEERRRRGFWRALGGGVVSVVDWLFGLVAIVGGLAVLSVIPVLNFFSLGYLLECSGRVAATGRIRDGFVGIRKASILGSLVIGTWLVTLPVRFVSGMWRDAELIAPGSGTAQGWRVFLIILTVLTVGHIGWSWMRGGRLWHFLWPAPKRFVRWLGSPGKYRSVRDGVLEYVLGLRLPHYFWLGMRGFAGAVVWLIGPVGILVGASQLPQGPAALLSLLGAAVLMVVVLYLPFMQVHFARTKRFRAMFEVGEVRRLFMRAPIAFWVALFVTLLFAMPLYLLKIELTPREVAWLPSLLFVIFIFPARLLTGWAMGRAVKREEPRHGVWRWLSRLAVIPVVFVYVAFVYLTQYLSWYGTLSLLEQHAFLVPAPIMAL
jgi:hypothetical protein